MVRKGQDLILSVDGVAIGFSSTCKITTTADTSSRSTKEAGEGLWEESYVTKLSESISFEGYDTVASRMGYDLLRRKLEAGEPILGTYGYVGEDQVREGHYILTQLEEDGTAGDDVKFSGQMKSCGAITEKTLATDGVTRTTGNNVEALSQNT